MVSSEDQGLDEVILQVFEEHEESFHFPVATQKEARAFVKALHGKGLSYDSLLHEIKELEQNFSAWRKGISRPGIGNRVIERINRPLQEILLSDGEEEDPDYLDQLSSDSDEVESNLNGIEVKNNGENRLTPDWKSNVQQTGNAADSQKQHDMGATCSGNTSVAGAIQSDCKLQGNPSVEVYDKAIDVTKNLSEKTEAGQDKVKDCDIQKDAPLEKTKQDSSIAENKTIVGASGKHLEIIEKKQEAVTEHQQTVTEKKQEAGTERKQEAVTEKETATGKKPEVVTEKKQEVVTEKKPEAAMEKKQEVVIEKKQEVVIEKKQETAVEKKQEVVIEKKQEAVTEKKLETAAERKQETAAEKKQEVVTEKKPEAAIEKKQEAVIEKKQEAVIEKKQEVVTEKKLETAAEKKQLVVTENKQEAVLEKKKETVAEKKEAVAEKNQEAVTETKQATTDNKLETVTEKKQNVVSKNKQEAVAEEKQIAALTNDEKTAQPVIVENKEVDLQGDIVAALEEVQDQRANKQKFVESLEGEKCESECSKKEIAGIAAQCKSEPLGDHVKRDEATLKEVHSTSNASKVKLEGEAASVTKSNEVVSQNKNSEIESEVVEHRSVNVHAAEPIDQTNLPEKENTSASISTVSSGADAENQKIKLDQLQCHPTTSDGKCQGHLNDILESYNSDFDDEVNHGSKWGVTTTSDDTGMTCGKPQVKNESQVGEGAGYVYVFTDSSAENVAYRVKVGASRFPHKKLQQALLFNIDMKLVSAVQVSDQRKALDAVHHQLNIFSIPKTVGWFCGPLESILNVLMAVAKDYPHQD